MDGFGSWMAKISRWWSWARVMGAVMEKRCCWFHVAAAMFIFVG